MTVLLITACAADPAAAMAQADAMLTAMHWHPTAQATTRHANGGSATAHLFDCPKDAHGLWSQAPRDFAFCHHPAAARAYLQACGFNIKE